MNKSESKYFNTAIRMDEAFLSLLGEKDFDFITIKEICTRSGVNRSTFYLHYESISDLLLESLEYINRKFNSYFEHIQMNQCLVDAVSKEKLIFITPEYLIPWLTFIRENKVLYCTVLRKYDTLQTSDTMFRAIYHIIDAVMERYGISEPKRRFMIPFYLEGINAIIKTWLNGDCQESIEEIIRIIEECVRPHE